MTELDCLTPAEAIIRGILLARSGPIVNARGIPAHEVRYPTIRIAQPWQLPPVIPGRKANWAIGAIEACSLVGQTSVPEWLTDRVTAFERFVEDGVLWGAYGPRIAGQLGLLCDTLANDRDTRQAVMTIFDGHRDLDRTAADIPCTIALQFMIREDRLELRTVMRSNDAWLGLTYDVVQFIALQGAVAQALGVEMGPYVHQPGSLHLYRSNEAAVDQIGTGYLQEGLMPYAPLWTGDDIDEISRRARAIAGSGGEMIDGIATPFERWLGGAIR